MFFLFAFVCLRKFCVEKTAGKCSEVCSAYSDLETMDHLPTYDEIASEPEVKVYLSESMEYTPNAHSSNNIEYISCDESIEFIFSDLITQMNIYDMIITSNTNYPYNSYIRSWPTPIKFKFEKNINIIFEGDGKCPINSINLEATQPNLIINPLFLTNNIDLNKLTISGSYPVNIYNKDEKINSIFTNPDQIIEVSKTYYCISDKENKCSSYSNYNPTVINSFDEITGDSIVLIVETSINQVYINEESERYIKFIGLEGSNIFYKQNIPCFEFFVFINENNVELSNLIFEGAGSFTLYTNYDTIIYPKTATNSIDFTLKRDFGRYDSNSQIFGYYDNEITLAKKIKVPDIFTFHGASEFKGFFEEGKYISHDEHYNIEKIEDLVYFDDCPYISYTFMNEGTYEIPSTMKSHSIFSASYGVTLVFKNVHEFINPLQVDNFELSEQSIKIVLHPSDFFVVNPYSVERNVDIQIDKDIIISGFNTDSEHPGSGSDNVQMNTIEGEYQCNFKGTGTVKFINEEIKNQIESRCQKEETVTFELLSSEVPNYYICVGQESLEKCKEKIVDPESGVDWIWIVDINQYSNIQNVQKIYVTDKQRIINPTINIVLTADAELTITESSSVQIYENHVNNIFAQSSTAKLIVVIGRYSFSPSNEMDKITIYYNKAPTGIDLTIFFDIEQVKMLLLLENDYVPSSIKLNGKSDVYISEYQSELTNIFSKPDSIVFRVYSQNDYEEVCLSDTNQKCHVLTKEFLHIKSYEELENLEKKSGFDVHVFMPLSLSMSSFDLQIDSNNKHYIIFREGSSLTFDVPDNSRVAFGYYENINMIEIIDGKNKAKGYVIADENVQTILNIKSTLFLGHMNVDTYHPDSIFVPKLDIRTEETSIEIITSSDLASSVKSIDDKYTLTIQDGVSISSQDPDNLKPILGSKNVASTSTCVYLNEEGKSLCGTKTSMSLEESKTKAINTKNIVVTSGIEQTFSIPSAWGNDHYLSFISPKKDSIHLIDISTLYYYSDGIIVDEGCKIISGNLVFDASKDVSFNVELPTGMPILYYMYFLYIDCGKNEQTNFHAGYLDGNQVFRAERCIHVDGYNATHKATVYLASENDLNELYGVGLLYGGMSGFKYQFDGYNYICYASPDEAVTKCTESNYYLVYDISSLINAINSYPDLDIKLAKNLVIPDATGKSFSLNAINENVEVTVPSSPKSINILENNQVKFNFDDSTTVNLLNKMKINVGLNRKLELSVSGSLQSTLTFTLNSDVLVSTNTPIKTTDFTINVVKNNFHLYAEDLDQFGSIFGNNVLELYPRICGYESGSESLCTTKMKDTIQNVFKSPFDYKEVEIAISSDTQSISLPSVSSQVNVVIKSEKSTKFTISDVSNIQLKAESVIINEFWVFNEKREILAATLNKESSLSISELITKPITLSLSNAESVVDLKDCITQNCKQITLVKFGEQANAITILGSLESYKNFVSFLHTYEGISLNQKEEQKYLCVCVDSSCDKCKEGISGGLITNSESINSDPGENVEIRIFSDIEVSSEIFNNEHNVVIDSSNKLTLNSVANVYQNIENKFKVDNLIFSNGNNVIIKPKTTTLNLTMNKGKSGSEFTIYFTNYLVLNAININEEGIVASTINVKGDGELNLYGYPSEKVNSESTIKIIKGIYIVCNSKNNENICIYETDNNYKIINNYENFENIFDKDSKIVVIINSYTGIVDVNINRLDYQQMVIVHQGYTTKLLADNDQARVRILSTNVLTSKADLSTQLEGTQGGISLKNDDSELFIVAFDDQLTIKQEGNLETELKPIVIQPQNDKATIVIDKSVDIKN